MHRAVEMANKEGLMEVLFPTAKIQQSAVSRVANSRITCFNRIVENNKEQVSYEIYDVFTFCVSAFLSELFETLTFEMQASFLHSFISVLFQNLYFFHGDMLCLLLIRREHSFLL